MYPKQPNLKPPLPVFSKQGADLSEDLIVQLSWARQSMGSGNRREIFVSEFQLNCSGVEICFAQSSTNHLGEAHQGGFELGDVGGIFVVSVLMADRLRIKISADFGIKPPSGVFAASFASKSEPPFAKAVVEFRLL